MRPVRINKSDISSEVANYVLANYQNAVDKIFVVSVEKNIGLQDLKKYLPKSRWAKSHHLLIFLGRRICSSRKPNCSACPLADKCKKKDVCR